MSGPLQRGKIDNVIPESHADSCRPIPRFEYAEGKILKRKMRIRRDVDERFQRHYERNVKARKSSRGSSKLQLPNEVTNFRRALIRSSVISQSRQANTVS